MITVYIIYVQVFKRRRQPPCLGYWQPWLGCAVEFGKEPLYFIERARRKVSYYRWWFVVLFTLAVRRCRRRFMDFSPHRHFAECWNIRSQGSFPGTFVPATVLNLVSSRELLFPRTIKPCRPFLPRTIRSVQGLFAPWYFRSSERKFPVGTFAPKYESSRELSFPGAKVPGNFRARERMLPGTFVPQSDNTREWTVQVTTSYT